MGFLFWGLRSLIDGKKQDLTLNFLNFKAGQRGKGDRFIAKKREK
jgi:hypothetical protein